MLAKTQPLTTDNTLITNNYEQRNGKLLSSTYGNSQQVSYTYDKFERIKTKTGTTGSYEYVYDNKGNIAKIKDNEKRYETKYEYVTDETNP
ncbi:MAG: hypothetical protein PHR25_01240 [Clostridia bacterium]|nr:hypothetical protein [Clostridia bacterium]MDD4375391.1 hypothetical protein [Clostridia bacterium]